PDERPAATPRQPDELAAQPADEAGRGRLAALLGACPQRPGAAQQAAGEGADRVLALELPQGAHQLRGVVADAGARPFHRERVDQDAHLAPPEGPRSRRGPMRLFGAAARSYPEAAATSTLLSDDQE